MFLMIFPNELLLVSLYFSTLFIHDTDANQFLLRPRPAHDIGK